MAKRAARCPNAPSTGAWSMDQIKKCNEWAGKYWFSPDTLRFFKSRIGDTVHQGKGGIYFISSEVPPHSPRQYTVRRFDPKKYGVNTVGDFQAFATRAAAERMAKKLASGK